MAQRGGAVLSTVKVGPFHGPLIGPSEAEIGLFLHADNFPIHAHYLRSDAAAVVNGSGAPGADAVDADGLAVHVGQPRAANLALLGYAAGKGVLFAGPDLFEETIRTVTPAKHLDQSLAAFRAGVEASR